MNPELASKPDYSEVLARFEAWWKNEPLKRPLITIEVEPSHPPRLPNKQHPTVRDRWMDVDYVLDCVEARIETGIFLADTVPIYMPFLGPEVCATLFGAELRFVDDETGYSVPVAKHVREILAMEPNLDSPYWDTIRRLTDGAIERGRGRWITGVTDLHTNGDLLAALRDPQELCIDCADDPEGVRLACAILPIRFHSSSRTCMGGLRRLATRAPRGPPPWPWTRGIRSRAILSA